MEYKDLSNMEKRTFNNLDLQISGCSDKIQELIVEKYFNLFLIKYKNKRGK